jgi:two-component system OmpR family response regulator
MVNQSIDSGGPPAASPAALPVKGEGRSSPPRSLGMAVARIAIADDDPDSLELIRAALNSPTNAIYEATTGAELVVLLAEQGPFDLVITDVNMPWMEGLHVLQSVRAANINTPALIVSGVSRSNLESTIAHLGRARLLRKPFAISDLRAAVTELLTQNPE